MGKADNTKNSSEIIYAALVFVIQLCRNIMDGKICMNDLEKCQGSTQQLQALCNAANSGNKPLCSSFDQIKNAMDLCSRKFAYVVECKKAVEVVVKHCSKISEGIYMCIEIYALHSYDIYVHVYMCMCTSTCTYMLHNDITFGKINIS